jgi:hypothetical protein
MKIHTELRRQIKIITVVIADNDSQTLPKLDDDLLLLTNSRGQKVFGLQKK